MAKATLSTNYIDDILHESADGKRKYRMVYNDDGTVSFDDVTVYDQEGSDFGAGDINRTNEAVNQSFDKNKLIRDMDAINAITQEGYAPDALVLKEVNNSLSNVKTYVGSDGKLHFVDSAGADSVLPFSKTLQVDVLVNSASTTRWSGSGYSKYILFSSGVGGSADNITVSTTNGTVTTVSRHVSTNGTIRWFDNSYIINTNGGNTTISWTSGNDGGNMIEVLFGLKVV